VVATSSCRTGGRGARRAHAPRAAPHRGRPQAAAQPAGRRAGLYHFGLKIGEHDDQLREALAQRQAAGVKIVGASDHTVTHSLYIEDPDGNEIELYVDVAGVDWRNDPTLTAAPVKPLRL
jgi:catechol 2,3-dioxygenase